MNGRRAPLFPALLLAAGLMAIPVSGAGQHLPSAAELQGRQALPSLFQAPDRRQAYASGWSVGLLQGQRRNVTGTLRILVVLLQFADSPEPTFTREQISSALFDGPSAQGTVSELYDQMSLGAFQVVGTVTPWIRTSLTLAEVRGGDLNNGEPSQTGFALLEAIAIADESLDLGQFDNDGPDGIPNSGDDNGFIDSVFFIYGEVGAHCGGNGPWPHFGGLSPWQNTEPYQSNDPRPDGTPVLVYPYVLSTAVNCAGTEIGAAPVAAHELGHVVGLPDFYHPAPIENGHLAVNRKWVLGCWELMAAGAWGCGPSDEVSGNFGPSAFSPWSKEQLGWLTVQRAEDVVHREYVLPPVQTSGLVLQVPLDPEGIESYLVEYRPQTGFDRVLPASGVMVYHWDQNGLRRPDPDSAQSYLVAVVEADDNASLQRPHTDGGNRGEAGDAWGNDGGPTSFTALTSPAPTLNSGAPAPVSFHSIHIDGGVARIRISSRETPSVVGADALPDYAPRDPIDVRLLVGGGVMPYSLAGVPTLPVGVSISMDGDALVLRGSPLGTGDFSGSVGIRDATARLGTSALRFVVTALSVARERLLAPFLNTEQAPLTEDQIEILDNDGNRNGLYDVGDLRAQIIGR